VTSSGILSVWEELHESLIDIALINRYRPARYCISKFNAWKRSFYRCCRSPRWSVVTNASSCQHSLQKRL